jgi:hypothetical protein
MSDNITLPRKHIDYAAHALEHFNKDAPDPLVSEIVHHLRTALAAEPTKQEPVRCNPAAMRTTASSPAVLFITELDPPALAAEPTKPEPVESEDDEEFTREDVTTLLLEVMDWTYVQATRDRPMTDAEKKVIDDIRTALAASEPVQVEPTPPITRITCGFVDVRFDGERWFCGKCGERMPANYEAMVKHYSGDREHLELMQRKAAFKMGRDKT